MVEDKVERIAERVMFFALCAVVYFAPISVALIESFFPVALVAYIVKRAAGMRKRIAVNRPIGLGGYVRTFLESYKPAQSCITGFVGLYILAAFISAVLSQHPGMSYKAFVFKILQDTFTFYLFVEATNTRKRLKIFLTIFLISITVVSLSGISQIALGRDFILGNGLTEGLGVNSSLNHPNDFGGYLNLVVPFFLATILFSAYRIQNILGLIRVKKMKSVWLALYFVVGFILTLGCLGFTFSRGAWAAFFIALTSFVFLRPKECFTPLIIIVAFSWLFFPLMKQVKLTPIFFEGSMMEEVYDDGNSIISGMIRNRELKEHAHQNTVAEAKPTFFGRLVGSGRQAFWMEALSLIRDHPIFGCGLNTYSEVVQRYKITWGGYPHNSYLHMMAEMGGFGLMAFLLVIVRLFQTTLRNLKKMDDPLLLTVTFGFLIGLLGFLAHSFVDTDLYSVQLITCFWLVVGCVVAAQKLAGMKA